MGWGYALFFSLPSWSFCSLASIFFIELLEDGERTKDDEWEGSIGLVWKMPISFLSMSYWPESSHMILRNAGKCSLVVGLHGKGRHLVKQLAGL